MGRTNISSAILSVIPLPPAALSTLTTTKSTRWRCTRPGKSAWSAFRPGSPKMSPIARILMSLRALAKQSRVRTDTGSPRRYAPRDDNRLWRLSLCKLRRAHFADDRHLDLPRIGHLLFDLAGDVLGQHIRLIVGHLAEIDHDPDFAPRLDGIGLVDPLERSGNRLQIFEPLHITFEHFSAGPRTRAGDRIGRIDQTIERRDLRNIF